MVCLLCSPSQSTPIEKRPVLSWGRRAHIVPIRTWIVLALPPRTSARPWFLGADPRGPIFAENGSIFLSPPPAGGGGARQYTGQVAV